MRWACSCETKRPNEGLKPNCARTVQRQPGATRLGRCAARRVSQCEIPRGDFVHDQLVTGRKIRVLTIVDTFSRFSPATDPRFSYKGEDVVQTLEQVCRKIGYPKTIRVDQGSEFISRDLDLWAYQKDVTLDFSRPRCPAAHACMCERGEANGQRVR